MEMDHALKTLKEEHIRKALVTDKGMNAHLDSWTTESFTSKTDNYSSTIIRVKIAYHQESQKHQDSYIAKLHPKSDNDLSLEMIHGDFTKDAGFYLEILPALASVLKECGLEELRVPRCYFASLERGKEMMILEDLQREKFKMYDCKTSLDVAHVTLVLQEVAKLHASSYILQSKMPDSDLKDRYPVLLQIDRRFRIFSDELIANSTENAYRVLQDLGVYERAIEWLARNKSKSTDILYENYKGTPPFDVICQGDFWINNFLFRYDKDNKPTEVVLLDFQDLRKSSLASELNELMYTSLDGTTRKKHIDSFLSTYYEAFKGVIEASGASMPFTFQELREEYKRRLEVGLLLGLVTVPWMVSGEEGLQWYEGPPGDEGQVEAFRKRLQVDTVKMLQSDPAARQRFFDIFDDMIEAGIM